MNVKTFFCSIAVVGLSLNTASAEHRQKVDRYATAVDREAHHLEEDLQDLFPRYHRLLRKAREFTTLAHTTEKSIHDRSNLDWAEYNINLMQRLISDLDGDVHLIDRTHDHLPRGTMKHLVETVHRIESYLRVLEREVHELNQPVVILPYPHHDHHYGDHHSRSRSVRRRDGRGGVRFTNGRFGFNIRF